MDEIIRFPVQAMNSVQAWADTGPMPGTIETRDIKLNLWVRTVSIEDYMLDGHSPEELIIGVRFLRHVRDNCGHVEGEPMPYVLAFMNERFEEAGIDLEKKIETEYRPHTQAWYFIQRFYIGDIE